MTRILLVPIFAGALLASATDASASLLAKTSYNNYPVGGINGQSGSGEVGFTGVWSASSGNLGTEPGGILDGNPLSGQGKFEPNATFSSFSRIARRDLEPQVDPPGNIFYMSHLVNAGGLIANGRADEGYAFVGFGDFTAQATIEGTANFLGGAFVGFVDSATNPEGVDLVIRSRTGAAAGVISDELLVADAQNTTFQVVMALEYNNPGDEVRYWVNPTDFSNGEAGLTASSSISGSIAGFQLGAASSMNDLTVATWEFDRRFFWDESILASSVAALPEPTTALMAGLSLLGLAARRR